MVVEGNRRKHYIGSDAVAAACTDDIAVLTPDEAEQRS
jgi:hypothetical protein